MLLLHVAVNHAPLSEK